MKITRYFTKSGQSPYEGIPFEPRKSEIRNPDGSTVFLMENVMVPAHWSQVATDILAQKYFRKAGLKTEAKRQANRVNDATKSRDKWRAQTEQLREQVEVLQAEKAALQEQLAGLKKTGTVADA